LDAAETARVEYWYLTGNCLGAKDKPGAGTLKKERLHDKQVMEAVPLCQRFSYPFAADVFGAGGQTAQPPHQGCQAWPVFVNQGGKLQP